MDINCHLLNGNRIRRKREQKAHLHLDHGNQLDQGTSFVGHVTCQPPPPLMTFSRDRTSVHRWWDQIGPDQALIGEPENVLMMIVMMAVIAISISLLLLHFFCSISSASASSSSSLFWVFFCWVPKYLSFAWKQQVNHFFLSFPPFHLLHNDKSKTITYV